MFDWGVDPDGRQPGTTGKYLVLLREDGRAATRALGDTAGLSVASAADFEDGAVEGDLLESSEAVVFDRLSVARVDAGPDQVRALGEASLEERSPILAVEPERVVYALEDGVTGRRAPAVGPALPAPGISEDFLEGYRDAVNDLVDRVLSGGVPAGAPAGDREATFDESVFTWGLQATRVAASGFSGKGVKIAVLDTGLDMGHPDFRGRVIRARSFVPDEEPQDGHGHGTHCVGTACGPERPVRSPRYGVAYDAEIFAGKVLGDRGSGSDGGILAGINWAITNRCDVISMSLGAAAQPGDGFSRIYEQVARRAFEAGTIIVAAAGNESSRPAAVAPVGHPANCPSIMAVAAVDRRRRVASFSSGSVNHPGGGVDIAAPGVNVRSSWPAPIFYNTISGTSMATPHVAGIAALHAEATPGARGRALAQTLFESARRLEQLSTDVGVGLVQAP